MHEAFSKHRHRASEPKSCSDPGDFLSPGATRLRTSTRMDGFVCVSSHLPHCSRRHWGGSDISIPAMKSSWHYSSPPGIPIRNANDLGESEDKCLEWNYMSLLCLSFSIPLLGIMQFPCTPPFSQVSRVLQELLGKCCTLMAVAELRPASCCNDIAPYGAFQPRFSP